MTMWRDCTNLMSDVRTGGWDVFSHLTQDVLMIITIQESIFHFLLLILVTHWDCLSMIFKTSLTQDDDKLRWFIVIFLGWRCNWDHEWVVEWTRDHLYDLVGDGIRSFTFWTWVGRLMRSEQAWSKWWAHDEFERVCVCVDRIGLMNVLRRCLGSRGRERGMRLIWVENCLWGKKDIQTGLSLVESEIWSWKSNKSW